MKKKIDFITNSSSTSFIVANKDKKLCFGKVKIELEVDFVDLLNSVDRYEVFTTEEEIKAGISIQFGELKVGRGTATTFTLK